MRFKLHSHDFCIWYPFYNLYDGKDPSPELPCLRGCELFFDNFDHFWHSWRGPELLQCRVVKVKLLQSHGFGYAMKGKDLIELKIQSTGSLGAPTPQVNIIIHLANFFHQHLPSHLNIKSPARKTVLTKTQWMNSKLLQAERLLQKNLDLSSSLALSWNDNYSSFCFQIETEMCFVSWCMW